jgi:hypothetical protein
MFKKYFLTGLAAGILSGLAAFSYYHVYTSTLKVSFPGVVSTASIFSSNIFAGIVIASLYHLLHLLFKKDMETLFSLLLAGGSMMSMAIPFMISLPLELDHPELFPGLIVPMHLFPALAWFVCKPVFKNYE